MKDTQLYQQLLGLTKPWSVNAVEVDMDNSLVVVHVVCDPNQVWVDPKTRARAHVHGWIERSWRHLDTCQLETRIVAKIPRLKYSDGSVEDLRVPWADRYSRITLMLEAFVLRLLQASSSHARVATLMRLDWHTVDAVVKRAVERGVARRTAGSIQALGLDEKSFGRGHSYVSVLTELATEGQAARVLDVVPERTLEAATQLLQCLTPEQRQGVQAIAMDMWPAYLSAARTQLPTADIVHDKFHVSKYLNEALDLVRRAEHRALKAVGDDTLSGSKFVWLKAAPDQRCAEAFRLKSLLHVNLKTARAWVLKESFTDFWTYRYLKPAQNFFKAWCTRAMRSRLEPVKKVVQMLRRHQEGLLNYVSHRITNAASEGFNSAIQTLKANARGFRSFESYRARILFHCGKLDLMPSL